VCRRDGFARQSRHARRGQQSLRRECRSGHHRSATRARFTRANQAFTVTAQVHDPDGLTAVQLKYRLDPSLSYATVNMNDTGTVG
jgi:hypothetical protein